MKWIGQHIYDLASRFRNDVFLEDISTGTIASGAHLGLDSNNKIVKAVDGGGDLTSIVAGTGLSGTSLTGPIPTLSVDATQAGITGLGTITSGTWQSATAVIASQYLDGDTAHLTTDQTFTGNKTFDETIIGSINGSAATVATIDDLAPNTATTQATQPAIESIGTDGDTLSILSDTLLMSNTSADTPVIKLVNTTNDDQAGQLIFEKLRADDAVAQGQNLGEIWFRGQDAAQNTEDYAYIIGEIDVSTSGQESGSLALGVASHDGSNRTGFKITGGDTGEVDVNIGLGSGSITTIVGTLTMGSTVALGNNGKVVVANQSNITGVGTITSGVWNGDVIASAYLDADTAHLAGAQTFTGTKTLNSFKGTAGATVTNILDEDAMGSASATALATQQSIKAYVDTRSSYVYQSFIGISNLATNWGIPHVNGWEAYGNQWNTDTGVSAATIGTSFTLSRYYSNVGFTVPFDGELVGFYATLRNHNADRASSVGLLHSTFSEFGGKTGTSNYTLQSVGTTSYNGGGGTSFTGGSRVIDMGREFALTAGDVIIPAILEADSDKVYFNITMVMKIDNGLTSQA